MRQIHPVEIEVLYQDEQKLKENRVVTLNKRTLTEKEVEEEENRRILMTDLYLGASSLQLAKKMEAEREDYFISLYSFSYGVSQHEEDSFYLAKTDSIALQIIEKKEIYDKRIAKLKEKYHLYRNFLNEFEKGDVYLIRSYFEFNEKVDYKVLRECFDRMYFKLLGLEEKQDNLLELRAVEEYRQFADSKRSIQSVKKESDSQQVTPIANENEGKHEYLIAGEFVYLTEKEYNANVVSFDIRGI